MSQRHSIEQHLHTLRETRDIMQSMKTLALMESRKLSRQHQAQQHLVDNIQSMAADFYQHHPDALTLPAASQTVWLLVGSERAFCGDFNNALLTQLDELHIDENNIIIAVGRKLGMKLEHQQRPATLLAGASVAEEVGGVLVSLTQTLADIQQRAPTQLNVLHHYGNEKLLRTTTLLPPIENHDSSQRYAHPPELTLPPAQFFLDLIEQHLFASLQQIFFASLLAENLRRMQHLEGAVEHLNRIDNELSLKRNTLRQEEITEEIEIILLNAGN